MFKNLDDKILNILIDSAKIREIVDGETVI
jgi:hypothetical protein